MKCKSKSILLLVLNNLHLFTYSKVKFGYHQRANAVKYEKLFSDRYIAEIDRASVNNNSGYFFLRFVKGQFSGFQIGTLS